LSGLLDAGATDAARLESARALAAMVATDEGRLAICAVLKSSGQDQSARWIMVRALAREPWVPESLFEPLAGILGDAGEGDRLSRTLAAIASIRTPEALRVVAGFLEPGLPEATRAAALAALVRATGREEIGPAPGAWLEWIARAEAADASDGLRPSWSVWVLRGLAERADRSAGRSRDLSIRLIDSQRRLYGATAPDQRPALLASMLRDDMPEVRGVGFELLERELVATPNPGPEVVASIMALLSNPSPAVRAQAAGFLSRIAPDGAGMAVAEALAVERDPVAAAALLTAVARWPLDAIGEPVLFWLEAGPSTRPVASEAALAMHRVGRWNAEEQRRIAEAMRRPAVTELTPPGIRLIALIGTLEDSTRLAELLLGGSPLQRSTVADALAGRAEHLDAILHAAAQDPALIPAAARAVATHRPTLAGFRQIVRLPGGSDAVRRDALRAVGEVLSPGDLLSAADEVGGDNATILWLLEKALNGAQQAVAAGQEGAMALLRESAERLARRRLDLDRPAEAIAALDVVQEQTPSSRLTTLRAVALIVLGRLDDAVALRVGADAWLDALERCVTLPHGPDVLAVVRRDFAPSMTPAQTGRLETLAARLEARSAEPPAPPG
jgi:hypothetical protein